MCTIYLVVIQKRRDFENDIWETERDFTLPEEGWPLCGCWLEYGDTTEGWKRIEEAHRASGKIDKLPETKKEAIELNRLFRERLAETLLSLPSWDYRLLIERLA